ncbi:MAG: MGMT family protein [Acidaminobacteraceae bacterium]
MNEFTKKAIEIIKSIPKGKVMTYKDVATSCGNYKGSRQVARVLHSMSERYSLPWHRVINSKGEISFKEGTYREMQINMLEREGVIVSEKGKIDLSIYRFDVKEDKSMYLDYVEDLFD